MKEFAILCNSDDKEYFCNQCGQFRLSFLDHIPIKCGGCEGNDIVVGAIGSLNDKQLKKDWVEKQSK